MSREELGDLRRRAAKAHRAGGIELYLSLQEVGPFTIPASLPVEYHLPVPGASAFLLLSLSPPWSRSPTR